MTEKKDKKPVYIRCPRCELNYCLKKDKYCSVCKAEMEGDKDAFSDDFELELCPICKTNYIQPDEIIFLLSHNTLLHPHGQSCHRFLT